MSLNRLCGCDNTKPYRQQRTNQAKCCIGCDDITVPIIACYGTQVHSIIRQKHHLEAVAAKRANRLGSYLKGSTK